MNLLTVQQLAAKLSCSVSYVWRLTQQDPTFPRPLQIGMGGERARGTRWVESAVNDWLLTKQQDEVQAHDDGRTGVGLHQNQGEEVPAEG